MPVPTLLNHRSINHHDLIAGQPLYNSWTLLDLVSVTGTARLVAPAGVQRGTHDPNQGYPPRRFPLNGTWDMMGGELLRVLEAAERQWLRRWQQLRQCDVHFTVIA